MNFFSYTLILMLLGYPISAFVTKQDDVQMGTIRVQPRSNDSPPNNPNPHDKGVLCGQNRFYSREYLSVVAKKALEEKKSCEERKVFCMFPMVFAAYEYASPRLPIIYPILRDGKIYESNDKTFPISRLMTDLLKESSELQGNHDRVVLTVTGEVLGATTSKPLENGTGNYYAPCAVAA